MTAAPIPAPDFDSAPFWDGCRAGHLAAQQCPACARFRWPPAEYCPFCHHRGARWVPLPGTGIVQSFVVVRRAFDPAFSEKVPYVVAHIALDGAQGVTIISNVVAETVESVAVGQRVAVEFLDVGPAVLPRFRPI